MVDRCEDYPCCIHAGDGGACPDSDGRFPCIGCGVKQPRDATSSYCASCLRGLERQADREREGYFNGY